MKNLIRLIVFHSSVQLAKKSIQRYYDEYDNRKCTQKFVAGSIGTYGAH
jgi:S-methylmethionine-dependent homocysteine/selenocysteine methylase